MPDIPPLAPTAFRFLYSYDGAAISLLERSDVSVLAPSDDGDVPAGIPVSGFWCELRDAAGATLWWQRYRHPGLFKTEVMLDDQSYGYQIVPPESATTAFSCVVPADIPGAESLALVGSDPGDEAGTPAVDILVHPLSAP